METTLCESQLRTAIRNSGGPFAGILSGGTTHAKLFEDYYGFEIMVSPSGRTRRKVFARIYCGRVGVFGEKRDTVLTIVSKTAEGYAEAAHAIEQFVAEWAND